MSSRTSPEDRVQRRIWMEVRKDSKDHTTWFIRHRETSNSSRQPFPQTRKNKLSFRIWTRWIYQKYTGVGKGRWATHSQLSFGFPSISGGTFLIYPTPKTSTQELGSLRKEKAEMIIGNLKPETNIVNHARNSTFQFTHLNFLTWGSDPLNLRSAIMSHPLHKKTATYMTPDSAAEDLLRRSTEAYYLSNCTREPSTLRDTGFVPGTGMNRINFDEQNVFRAK